MTTDQQWRCFFCDDVFTTREAAALHFGSFDSCDPDVTACKLMAHQQHVLEYIRGLEEEISLYQAENHPTIKAMYAVEDEMRRAVAAAEEKGYARGVEDMKRQGYCVEPEKHAFAMMMGPACSACKKQPSEDCPNPACGFRGPA